MQINKSLSRLQAFNYPNKGVSIELVIEDDEIINLKNGDVSTIKKVLENINNLVLTFDEWEKISDEDIKVIKKTYLYRFNNEKREVNYITFDYKTAVSLVKKDKEKWVLLIDKIKYN